jgi:hypothetical protein
VLRQVRREKRGQLVVVVSWYLDTADRALHATRRREWEVRDYAVVEQRRMHLEHGSARAIFLDVAGFLRSTSNAPPPSRGDERIVRDIAL